MRYLLLLILLVGCVSEEPIVCSTDFNPVCGKINVQCITEPCNPVDEDFLNRCVAEQNNAFDIRDGECREN